MGTARTPKEKILNWFYSIPAVAQWWAKQQAEEMTHAGLEGESIPFARLEKPLNECTVALITTGGIHLHEQTPFDMDTPDGDVTYREIPFDVGHDQLTITHKYYDHGDADKDVNVIFPLEHFRELASEGVIGAVSHRHFSFMGHIDGPLVAKLQNESAPEVANKVHADGVDFVFLTPA